MFWLVWQMGLPLLLVGLGGVLVGYLMWGGHARGQEADRALADNARLRQENENLARRLGEASARPAAPAEPAKAEPAKAEAKEPEPVAATTSAPAEPPAVKAEAVAPEPATEPAREPVRKPRTKARPAAKTATPAPAAAPAVDDDLTRIKGLGPKAEAALKAGGVTTIAQIAEWSETDVEVWDDRINGRGRIVRDDWVAQAKDMAG